MDFRISYWISGFHVGFLDFTLDFWISLWISGFPDFLFDFWISKFHAGFRISFLDFLVYEISFVSDPSVRGVALYIMRRAIVVRRNGVLLSDYCFQH